MPRLNLPEKTPDALKPGIRPDAIIMRNGMGESVFVPKKSYEDFERFLNSESDESSAVSIDRLERMAISVNVDQNFARLKVEATANLTAASNRRINIPISMGSVQAVPTKAANGSVFEFPPLRVSSDGSGYLWSLPPGPIGERKLSFEATCNVRSSTQGKSLRLDLPAVSTLIRFEVPAGQWDLEVVGNGTEVVEPFQDEGTLAVAVVRTTGGTIVLNWDKRANADQVQAIEVESQTKYVPLMESGEFRAISNLAVRGPRALGGRRFLITLPERSTWREPIPIGAAFPGYRLGRSDVGVSNGNTVILLEFEEAFSRSEIDLTMEWQMSIPPKSNQLEFSMLQVEGIQRHTGTVELGVPRNVSVQWKPQSGIQFLRQSLSSDGSDILNYYFKFNMQSEALRVQWITNDRATDLNATYHAVYESSTLHLSGTIDILGDVRHLPFLQLEVRDWEVDRVQLQPSGRDLDLSAIKGQSSKESPVVVPNTTSIPFSLGELLDSLQSKNSAVNGNRPTAEPTPMSPDSSDLVTPSGLREESARLPTRSISFVLSRPTVMSNPPDGRTQDLGFSLPMISWLDPESQQRISASVGGEMTIQSVTARLEDGSHQLPAFTSVNSTLGKQSELTKASSKVSSTRFSILKYRVAASTTWLDWKGTAQSIGAFLQCNVQTNIALSEEGIDLFQSWTLVPTGETAKSIVVAVPSEWIGNELKSEGTIEPDSTFQLKVDGVPATTESSQNKLDRLHYPFDSRRLIQRYQWIRVDLTKSDQPNNAKQERLITIQKRLKYPVRLTGSPVSFEWLLPWMVADNQEDTVLIERYSGVVEHDKDIHCVLDSPFEVVEKPTRDAANSKASIAFDRTQLEPRLDGSVSLIQSTSNNVIEIDSVWLQTVLNASQQRDRYVFRISTRSKSISVRLPVTKMANADFLVNGRKAVPVVNSSDDRQIDVLLDTTETNPKADPDVYVVEMFLWTPNKSKWLNTLSAETPQILNCTSKAPFAWQIVVPPTVHLIRNSSTLSPGYHWQWQDLCFARTSDWTQERFSAQMGATKQPFVSQETNQYVFFSLDHTVSMTAWTAPRYLLWAPIALGVLIGSFFVMEFKWIRRPWICVGVILTGFGFSQWAWDLSIALAQCFVAALGISMVYSTLKWIVDRRTRRRSIFSSRPSGILVPNTARASPSGSAALPKPSIFDPAPEVQLPSIELPPSTTNPADIGGLM